MASKEMAIFHKTQWLEGTIYGAEATDSNTIVNSLKRLNDDNFSLPVTSNWTQNNLMPEYSTVDVLENKINIKVKKETSEDSFTGTEFSLVETGFTKNGIPHELDYISINFDWKALSTNFEENCTLEFNDGLNSQHKVILSNKSKIKLFTTDGSLTDEKEVVDSSLDSIGSIASYISNNLTDWYVDVRLDYDDIESKYYIETRLRSSGYESVWYRSLFGANEIANLKVIQNANPSVNAVVEKEINIKDIYVEGYESDIAYESKVFDGGENDTIWEDFTLSGVFPKESILDSAGNSLKIKLYASNNIETITADKLREYTLSPTENEFTILQDLEEAAVELEGRYLFIELTPSLSKDYQNEIDYFKVEYTLPSSLSDYVQKEVTEVNTSQVVGTAGGVVELDTEFFPVKLYIPAGALAQDETITVRRVPSSESTFADDIIGFEFGPTGLDFLKPALLEVDYSSFYFNAYQNEEGLKLAYLDNVEPEELNTVIDMNKKKAISYIEHFSTYGIMAVDNLYSPRTANAARKHPRWMKIRDRDSNFQKLTNYTYFNELDKTSSKYYEILKNYFIDRADTSMKFMAFKTKAKNFLNAGEYPILSNTDQFVAKYKGRYIPITFNEREFYNSKEELSFFNLNTEVIYFAQPYDGSLKIIDKYNNKEYILDTELVEHKIWNVFDEFALLFDIERNKREDNISLKERILDYGLNPGDSTQSGMVNHIARELGISRDDVQVNALSNSSYIKSLKKADGSASDKLISISNYINNHLNIYWDQWVWDEGYWDIEEGEYDFIF